MVLFDINRLAEMEPILWQDPKSDFLPLFQQESLPFTLSLITNSDSSKHEVVLRTRPAGEREVSESAIGFGWPFGVYSLSHVALPFRRDDPLYGPAGAATSPGIHLGDLALRGERGVLQVPAADMLRLRWNPFYPLMEERIEAFIGLDAD